jgi:GntR family transcriptional repressor for pyruvate dehydrogenase complex
VFRPVVTRRTFEEAVNQIVEAIQVGDLSLGDKLPSERALAAQMAISRPTLREAVKVLARAGVVEVRPGSSGGIFVRSDHVPRHLIEERSNLRLSEVSSVLEARRLFEPRVAQLAGVYGTDEDFDTLQRSIDLQRNVVDDRDRFSQLDVQFHLAIARATKNPMIVSLMRVLLRELEIARDMALGGNREPLKALAIHERTLSAIASRDPTLIDEAMDEHMSYLEDIWRRDSGRALRGLPDYLRLLSADHPPAGGDVPAARQLNGTDSATGSTVRGRSRSG